MLPRVSHSLRRILSIVLCLSLFAALLPLSARGREDVKKVRVGWFESSFHITDPSGRLSGYAYDYQVRIAAYTGWEYEYVHGSWPDLMDMLERGEIDLMSDVSYTQERSERMLFSSLPMGTEEYYLFVAPGNQEITPVDKSSLNGKRVGVNQGSVQADQFAKWVQDNGVSIQTVEVNCSEEESIAMLNSGELDAYVTVDSFIYPDDAIPVFKIGSSDFFFAVSNDRSDLLAELDAAISRIQDEDRYYNMQLFEKYFKRKGASAYLTSTELDWLARHGTIRVGYQDDYLAFCGTDKTTGEFTGTLKDYLDYAADCTANAHLSFSTTAYPTAAAAMEALQRGEVDCVFPANLSAYDSERSNIDITSPVISTDLYAVVRLTDQRFFSQREHVVVAVCQGDVNLDALLMDYYPDWQKIYFPHMEQCLKAVGDGMADCVLISNYRYNSIARLCERYHLTTFTTGNEADYSFAVTRGDTELYSILTKTVGLVPDTAVNAALSYYITEEARITVSDFVADHWIIISVVIGILLAVILALMIRSMKAERRAEALIRATETDDLTSLYNRDFFLQYANRIYREHPDTPMDAIVLNLEQFHSVNALKGRQFGDDVLRAMGSEIFAFAKSAKGIAGRFEADRFDIYCPHREHYQPLYERLQQRLNTVGPHDNLRLRMGVMPWQQGIEPVVLFDRARTACSMARGNYKEHLIVFDETLRHREAYEQRLLNDLHRALTEYEFDVYYQPKFNIQCDPPRLSSAEALIRWRHPELGLIPPSDFIPLFERNGQIYQLDQYVWAEAARQIVAWQAQYGVFLPVSVNLSRVDIFEADLESVLDEILNHNGLGYDALKLEVTESAYTENADHVIQVVKRLRRKGFQVEMDDFGTGYSSLNMLSSMPIDVLKMDQVFVRNIGHNEKDIQLVALILEIAKSLKIPVVAEGVETEEQLRLLKSLGCELVQGYYFSRPLHASEFETTFIRKLHSAASVTAQDSGREVAEPCTP